MAVPAAKSQLLPGAVPELDLGHPGERVSRRRGDRLPVLDRGSRRRCRDRHTRPGAVRGDGEAAAGGPAHPVGGGDGLRPRGRGPRTPAVARRVGRGRVGGAITPEDRREGDLGDPRLGIAGGRGNRDAADGARGRVVEEGAARHLRVRPVLRNRQHRRTRRVVSGGVETVTVTGVESVVLPTVSVARATTVYWPGAGRLLHVTP